MIANNQTDLERWRNPAQLEASGNRRAQLAADLIPAGAVVLDLGCGCMALERLLPPACTYLPCDVVRRDDRTIVCDFNAGEFPELGPATHIAILGVVEYLHDVPSFLRTLRACDRPIILSYSPTEFEVDRSFSDRVNHLRLYELEHALSDAGLAITTRLRVGGSQILLRLSPDRPRSLPQWNVVVVSASGMGNFGDRLGYHLINELLPAHATVQIGRAHV
jgi:hypothetical protein